MWLLFKLRVVIRCLRKWPGLVLFDFEVKLLKWFKRYEIIKIANWLSINLLHKGSNIGFVLNRTFDFTADLFEVEAKFKLDVHNVFFQFAIGADPHVLSCFPVFNDHPAAVSSGVDIFINKSFLNSLESLTCPHSDDLFVYDFQKDLNKPLSH